MGKFSRIIKHNKKSLSIDEKIKFLDKEMEKTGLNEKMTTKGMYSIVQPDPGTPEETEEVPNTSGIGGEGFNQSSAGSGNEGEAPSHSDLSQLTNSAVGAPIFDSPSGSFGVVKYSGTGAGTNYGIITGGNIVELALGGFIAGGTRAAQFYVDEYEAILAAKQASPGSYSDEQVESKRVAASIATSVESIRNSALAKGLEFNIPWQGYRQPQFMESLVGRTTFSHGTKGTLVLSGFSLLGIPNRYVTQPEIPPHSIVVREDDLGDSSFLPINIPELSKQGFNWLLKKAKEFAEAVGDFAMMEPQDFFNAAVSGAFPPNPENNYAPDIAGSIAENEPRTYENDDIPDDQKEKLIKNMNWNDIGGNIPIKSKPTNYSDDNFYVNDDGKVTSHTSDSKTNFPPNTHSHQGNTPNYNDNPLANAGEFHFELVVPEDGSEPYFNYEDHAYYNPNSADKGEVPNWVSNALANISQAAGSDLPGYPKGIKGDVVKKVKIPLSAAAQQNPDIKNSAAIKNNPALSSFFNESLDESVKLGHFEPETLTVDIEDLRKGIVPEFPKKAPPKMIDGYSEKSKLAPKKVEKEPFIKITKKDLAKNHLLKDSEIKEFMDQINAVNEYIKKHPEELIYVQQRYPKDDKRLAALNWKMDQMLESGEEYLDTQFPENQRLVDRIKKATKKTMELTNPEAYKGLKKPDMELMSLDDRMKEKRVVSRHFKKKRQSNSMFRVDMEKVKEKNRKVAEQKVAEWQEKRRIELLNSNEFENEKSDWKKDLQDK